MYQIDMWPFHTLRGITFIAITVIFINIHNNNVKLANKDALNALHIVDAHHARIILKLQQAHASNVFKDIID